MELDAAINTLLVPAISELFVWGGREALRALVGKATLWTLLGALSIALPVALLAVPLLALFGRDFGAGTSTLRILLIGQVVAAGAGSQLYLMTMTGHERKAAILLVSSAVANAIFSAALIDSMGSIGPAVATTTTLALWNWIMVSPSGGVWDCFPVCSRPSDGHSGPGGELHAIAEVQLLNERS